MTDLLEQNTLERWRQNPLEFIEKVLHTYDIDSQRFAPFKLYDAQRLFLKYAWQTRGDGRLLYPEQVFSTIKKSGKTAFAAAHVLTTLLIFGGLNAQGFCVANDFQQAQGRVFDAIVQICKNSPYLKRECEILQDRITYPQTGAVCHAISSSDTSAAGAHPTISSFDELWGFGSTRLRRLWEEFIPVPTRLTSGRLVTSHAGYSGESDVLEEIYKDGLTLPEIEPGLRAGNNTLFFWSHDRLAAWQTEQWLADMRLQQKRPAQFVRQFENRFVSSENPFIEMSAWDKCVSVSAGHMPDSIVPIIVAVDAGWKHDSTAVVAVNYDKAKGMRLVTHRIFQPSKGETLDFEETIERTVLDLKRRYPHIKKVVFDPTQLISTMQRLTKAGVRCEEFKQTPQNLTRASQTLYDLIQSRGITLYPDAEMRRAVSRCVAKETSYGWRIAKDLQSYRIDVVVALAMACTAAVESQNESLFQGFGPTETWTGYGASAPDESGPQSDYPLADPGGQSYEELMRNGGSPSYEGFRQRLKKQGG